MWARARPRAGGGGAARRDGGRRRADGGDGDVVAFVLVFVFDVLGDVAKGARDVSRDVAARVGGEVGGEVSRLARGANARRAVGAMADGGGESETSDEIEKCADRGGWSGGEEGGEVAEESALDVGARRDVGGTGAANDGEHGVSRALYLGYRTGVFSREHDG